MTEEQIKEQLSRLFLQAIVSRAGCKAEAMYPDHGCDLHVTQALPVPMPNGMEFVETGNILQIQLKSACERVVDVSDGYIRYDLSVRAYNALVHRRHHSSSATPFLLVLLLLPDLEADWLTQEPERLSLHKRAYWWLPSASDSFTSNAATKRILIPTSNTVGLDFAQWAFRSFF